MYVPEGTSLQKVYGGPDVIVDDKSWRPRAADKVNTAAGQAALSGAEAPDIAFATHYSDDATAHEQFGHTD